MLIVQSNEFNDSRIQKVVCVVLTSNPGRDQAPGNVRLSKISSGLKKESVVNVSQLVTLDRRFLSKPVRHLPAQKMREVDEGIRLVLSI